ncbi:hypothetical protein MLD38_029559 [Melastoma candidum]|uniref:Uncharacterized protein n=1 Tax=Melastoma candidum TaxID=119954 RepID=A0ACB9N5S8_9MYRT|nr:hypothetical protein MLD38_029559 [Melastoma candidum]
MYVAKETARTTVACQHDGEEVDHRSFVRCNQIKGRQRERRTSGAIQRYGPGFCSHLASFILHPSHPKIRHFNNQHQQKPANKLRLQRNYNLEKCSIIPSKPFFPCTSFSSI